MFVPNQDLCFIPQFEDLTTMRVAVIGATGYGGSYICVELLNRGYDVLGVSRHPEKLGKHEKYSLRPMDVAAASIEEIVEVFKGVHAVVNSYNPSPGPTMYRIPHLFP